jgi:predicted Fe-S protein YdhL (DUF1289 family)
MTASSASPCTGVCRLDEATGWCIGCLRTLDEIALWSVLDAQAKAAVRQELVRRRRTAPVLPPQGAQGAA